MSARILFVGGSLNQTTMMHRIAAHLPEHARGVLGPIDDISARQIRAMLLNHLNR